MAKIRCNETSVSSFSVTSSMTRKASKNDSLKKLNEVVDWDRFKREARASVMNG